MGSPDSQPTPAAAVPPPPATAALRRPSAVNSLINGKGSTTNGRGSSDHDNSSEDEGRQDRGDAGSEGARKRRRIDGISS
jgi:hypothetical protein